MGSQIEILNPMPSPSLDQAMPRCQDYVDIDMDANYLDYMDMDANDRDIDANDMDDMYWIWIIHWIWINRMIWRLMRNAKWVQSYLVEI